MSNREMKTESMIHGMFHRAFDDYTMLGIVVFPDLVVMAVNIGSDPKVPARVRQFGVYVECLLARQCVIHGCHVVDQCDIAAGEKP